MPEIIDHVPSTEELREPELIILGNKDGDEVIFEPLTMKSAEGRYSDVNLPVVIEFNAGSPKDRITVFKQRSQDELGNHDPEYVVTLAHPKSDDYSTYATYDVLSVISRQNPSFTIGRTTLEEKGLHVEDYMSREHARIELQDDGRMSVEDLKSTNHTEVYVLDKKRELVKK